MANELKITDVVDAKAIADLRELNQHLLATKENYISVVESIGKGISAPVKSFGDLTDKAKNYEEAMKQLGEAQKQIINIQSQYSKLLDEVNKKVSAKVKEEVEASKATLNNAKAETEAAKQRKLNADAALKEAKLQQQEAKKQAAAQMSVSEALENEAKSVNEAAAQNRVLRQAIRELDITTEDAVETFELYAAKINANDELMDRFSDNMTARKRNIGNYASAWNGLGMSVQQLARELPSLSMGFNTFFLAISNNLPILADEIKRAQERFKELKEAGEEAEPVWKQLGKSIFSLQTLLLVGITVLSMYGDEILAWVKGLFDANKGLKDLKETQEDVNNAVIEGSSGLGDQLYLLNELSQAWKELNGDLDAQNKFLTENRDKFAELGVVVDNVNDAENLLVTNTDNYIKALMLRAKAAAAAKLAQEEYEKEIKKQIKADTEEADSPDFWDYMKASGVQAYNSLGMDYGPKYTAEDAKKQRVEGLREEAEAANTNAQAYQNLAQSLEDEAQALLESSTIRERVSNINPTTLDTPFESQLTGNYADYSYLVHDEDTINKIAEEYAKSVNAAIQQNMQLTSETYAWMSVRSQQFRSMELDALAEQYEKGLIDKEKYEQEKAEITERYGIEQAQMAVDLAKEQLTSGNFTEEERYMLEQEIAKAEIKLAEKVRDAKIKATEETNEAIEKSADKTKITLEDALSFASETLGAISDLSAAFNDRELENIEKQEEANEEQYEKDIARIEKLEESGAISKEEAEARKRAAEEQTAAKEKELEKKRAEVQERQAKFDKAVSISQAIIATALGILQTIKNVGMPAAIPLIALQSALGAIQLATIIAQPIPKYAKGTKDHKGGLAIVGDGGKREAVFMNGEMYATPDVPTLVNLPKHAVVMPDLSKITSMDGAQSDLLMLLDRKNKQDKGVVVNVNNDYTKLEKRMDANSYELKQIKKLLKIQNLNTDRAMIYSRL